MPFRQRLSVAVTSVALVGLAACGGTSGSAEGIAAHLSADTLAAEMSSATAEATSTHVEAEVSFLGETMTMSGELATAEQLRDFQAQVTMEVPEQGTMEMRVVDGQVYVTGGGVSSEPGKPWVRIDLTDPSNPLGAFYEELVANSNPAQVARMFEAVTELDNQGTEDIDGTDVTRYAVTVDVAKALELTGLANRPGLSSLGAEIADEVEYDVWLETDTALLVRMSMDLEGMQLDLHFSDWGHPVSVGAPPADEVTDFDF